MAHSLSLSDLDSIRHGGASEDAFQEKFSTTMFTISTLAHYIFNTPSFVLTALVSTALHYWKNSSLTLGKKERVITEHNALIMSVGAVASFLGMNTIALITVAIGLGDTLHRTISVLNARET